MADEKIIFSMVGVSKTFTNQKKVLNNIYLSFFYGAKIGIIGLNGSGKSTLMKIIAGIDKNFQGEVVFSPGYTVGYLEQEPKLDDSKTVREVVEEGCAATVALLKEYEEINMKLCEPMDDDTMAKLIERQGELYEQIDQVNGWELDSVLERGLGQEAVDKLQPILELSGDNSQKLTKLREVLAVSETGLKGIEEMETVFGYVQRSGIGLTVELDLSLARGLNYYTGAIFEVKALDFAIGSICGGGRYDDLTGIFGMPNMSGVGISFGADRIYDVMTGLNLFPEEVSFTTRVFFINLGAEEEAASLELLRSLRDAGVAAEIYPECGKMKKQMEYANRRSIPYVVIIGSQELEAQAATVKDMRSGEQRQVPFAALAADLESRR